MLTITAAVTAAVTAVANLLVLFSIVDWTPDQIAGINVAVVAVGTLIHALLNPAVPIGKTE
jgi:hypothetical protein